MNTRGSGL